MKYCIFICLLVFIFHGYSQNLTYKKGVIIDTIEVNNSNGESFALYLPEEFNSDVPSPIVFIFDPAARGRYGLIPFIEAADKYQMILVCSNSSRNMAYETNFSIADRWFKDIFSRFTIDPTKMYLAGFSGGARLASTIAVLSGQFKAVVGCGAAFSGNSGHWPVSGDQFYFAGLVGNQDMNYQEMIKAADWLDRIGMSNQIFIFEDDHRWPDAKYISKAFDWFYLLDIKKNLVSDDRNFLDRYLVDQLTEAQFLSNQSQVIEAVLQYERIIKDLDDYFTLDSLNVKVKELKNSKDYKKSLKSRKEIASEESAWTTKLISKVTEEMKKGESRDNFRWLQKELAKLDKEYVGSSRKDYQHLGRRLQQMLFAMVIENFETSVSKGNNKDAQYLAQLSVAIWGDEPWVRIRLAKGFAVLEEKDKALSHLQAAIDNGWDNKEWILKTKAFNILTDLKEFQLLLQDLQ